MTTITIGKSKKNQCVFSNGSVSRQHAVLNLSADERTGILKDLNSTNGTFVNGKRIFGDTQVTVSDKIMFGTEQTSLQQIVQMAKRTRVQTPASQPSDRIVIGRSAANKVVLNYEDVSSHHAAIYKDDTGSVFIEDLNSTNGTYVNGVKVTGQKLKPGDIVMICGKYSVNWEQLISAQMPKPKQTEITKKHVTLAAALLAVVCLGVFVAIKFFGSWDQKKIYNEYSSAVCFAYVEYGYQIYIDDTDATKQLFNCDLIHFEDGEIIPNSKSQSGTAFFISDDGKLATNLHLTRPWLYTGEQAYLKEYSDQIKSALIYMDSHFARSKVELRRVCALMVIPNGLPITMSNAIECEEISASDNIQKDVAIMQTTTRKLPPEVKRIISLDDAASDEDAVEVGSQIFTIGFPYGAYIGLDSNNDLRNQVHSGNITQNRGEYEFSHDAETAGGASGSPIFNNRGQLIGVHHAGVSEKQGFNSAIKVKHLKQLLNR